MSYFYYIYLPNINKKSEPSTFLLHVMNMYVWQKSIHDRSKHLAHNLNTVVCSCQYYDKNNIAV